MAYDPKTLLSLNKALAAEAQKRKDLEIEIQRISGEEVDVLKEQATLNQNRINFAAEFLKFARLSFGERTKINKALGEEIAQAKEKKTLSEDEIKILEKKLSHFKKLHTTGRKRRKQAEELLKSEIQTLAQAKKNTEESQEQVEQAKQQADIYKKQFPAALNSVANKLTGIVGIQRNFEASVAGSFINFRRAGGELKNLGQGIKEGLMKFPVEMLTAIAARSMELAVIQSRTIAGFQKSTQAGEAYSEVIKGVQAEMRIMGHSFDDVAESTGDLFMEMTDFKDMSESARVELAEFTTLLDKSGVSSRTQAKTFQILTKTLGMSQTQVQGITSELAGMAQELDLSVNEVVENFVSAESTLSAHGPKMIKVFKGIQAQARATGIASSDLLEIASQFDTFDGAAESVAKLNAILGVPYLNSVEMVYATEEERIAAMRESLDASGKQWSALSKYERLAVMTAAGIKDIGTANRLFGTSMAELAEQQKKATGSAALSQEELQKMSLRTQDIMTKLVNILNILTLPLGIVVDWIDRAVTQIYLWNKAAEGWIGYGILIATGIASLITGFSLLRLPLIAAKVGLSGVGAVAAGAGRAVGGAVAVIGRGLGVATPYVFGFGVALIKLGFGVALVGLGIGLAVGSIALLVMSFTKLLEVAISAPEAILTVTGAVLTLSAGFIGLAFSAGPAAFGLGMIALSFVALAGALLLIKTKDLVALGNIFSGLGDMAVGGVASAISSIGSLIAMMGEIETEKLMKFGVAFKHVGTFVQYTSQLSPETAIKTKELFDSAAAYVQSAANVKVENTQVVNNLMQAVTREKTVIEEKPQTLVLKVNDRELGRVILNAINKENRLSVSA